MKKFIGILAVLLPLFCFSQVKSHMVPFGFKLASAANTSAGVYTPDGVLLRTLWSNVAYNSGTFTKNWDGLDDEGRLVANGKYTIKVLSNNVTYNWDGVIGNTSSSKTGGTVVKALDQIAGIVVVGNTAYCAASYNEGQSAQFKLNTSSPQSRTSILPLIGKTSQATFHTVSDGVNVYWGGFDPFSNTNHFVFATKISDDLETPFASGVPYQTQYGRKYIAAIDYLNNSKASITGMAVQKTGNFLFVSHKDMNEIHVLNKTTGALVKTITNFITPKSLAIDGSNNIWISYGTSAVEKYKINDDGSLSAPLASIVGLTDPLAIAISPDNLTVALCDGGTSQQVKAFNNTNAAPLWTLGEKEGYKMDATVTNNKFYFRDADNLVFTFISFQPDGSFWVGDTGNCRIQHYSSARQFIDRVMYLPRTYSTGVNSANANRVFSNFLEFAIDYSKPLEPNNGSWTLVKNWAYNVPATCNDAYFRLKGITTLSNGRTYGIVRNGNNASIAELVDGGTFRLTNFTAYGLDWGLYKDGSLWKQVYTNGSVVWSKRPLTGFDNSNNPIYGAEVKVHSIAGSATDPVAGGPKRLHGEITSSNIMVSFNGTVPTADGMTKYHLGGVAMGDNKWKWKTAIATAKDYRGDYPKDGGYDIGNTVQYAGSVAMAIDRSIIWGYNGEFWKNTQTNKYNHIYDNGLMIGQFGVVGDYHAEDAAHGMAGNSFSPTIVKVGEDYYLYHNDEGQHGAMHRWKISGLNTIAESNTTVQLDMGGNGLLGRYYEGTNLDNFNVRATRVDADVNFNWATGKPVNSNLSSADNFSASYSGFIAPSFSELYTFYTLADDGVRLWVDGKLLIDRWTSSVAAVENSANISLQAGKLYHIRIDYMEASGNASLALLWSSASQAKSIVPSSRLFPADQPDYSSGVDLMEGLPTKSVLQNNMYGWTRAAADEDYKMAYYQYWSVKTNVKTPATFSALPDVTIRYSNPAANYNVSRNLGIAPATLSSWKLSGDVSFEDSYTNTDGGGSYVEVVDEAGKIIARFHTKMIYGSPNQTALYGNNKLIAQGEALSLRLSLNTFNSMTISSKGDSVTFAYNNFPVITVPKYDATSNVKKPKLFRLSFFSVAGAVNLERNINLKDWKYSMTNTYNSGSLPAFTTSSQLLVAENVSNVITVNANSGVAGNKVSYAIIGGEDRNLFAIDAATGKLAFKNAPDFEAPADGGLNNVYGVVVKAFDGVNVNEQTLAITVSNVSEAAPVLTCASELSVNENTITSGVITAKADAPTAVLKYTIAGGDDAALFTIDGTNGQLAFKAAPDFEEPMDADAGNHYKVNVKVVDGVYSADQSLTVNVLDVEENPLAFTSATSFDVSENTSTVGTVATQAFTSANSTVYSIVGSVDDALFSINPSTGALTFTASPDFENAKDTDRNNVYLLTVRAVNGVFIQDQALTINVLNVDENPLAFSSATTFEVKENNVAIGTVAVQSFNSANATVYSIVGGVDATLFTINSTTGALGFAAAADYENAKDADRNNVYQVSVRATNGTYSKDQALLINVLDVEEFVNPLLFTSASSFDVKENTTVVGTMALQSFTSTNTTAYSISGGVDAALFAVNAATGAVTFKMAPDHENAKDADRNNVYLVNVRATNGLYTKDQALTVNVIDATDQSPVINTSAVLSINENITAITTLSGTPDVAGTAMEYYIIGGDDRVMFNLVTTTGALSFKAAPNYEAPKDLNLDNVYQLQIRFKAGASYRDQLISVTVNDVLEVPVQAGLSNEIFNKVLVSEVMTEEIALYPNPVSSAENVQLKITGYANSRMDVRVYNIGGQLLHHEMIATGSDPSLYQLSTRGKLAPGQYIARIACNNREKVIRFMVM